VNVVAPGSIRVADQGPGIPEDLREQIFERFWRGRGERRSGAGLGLSIVRDIMRAHAGGIEITENPSGGAVFIVSFRAPTENNDYGQDK